MSSESRTAAVHRSNWKIIVLVLLCLSAVSILAITTSADTSTESGDFEAFTVGTSAPGDWTGGTVVSRSLNEQKSLNITGTETATLENSTMNTADFNTTALIYTGNSRTDFEIRSTNGTGSGVEFRIDSVDGLAIAENGGLTGSNDSSKSVDLNSWYWVEGRGDGSQYELRVWKAGSGRPESPNLTLDSTVAINSTLTYQSGQTNAWTSVDKYSLTVFSGDAGGGDNGDGGSDVDEDEKLRIETREYLEHNTTVPFEVWLYNNSTDSYDNVTTDPDLNVTVENTSVVTVSGASITSTNDTTINQVTWVNATWEPTGLNDSQKVVVANETIENVDILPPMQKFTASVGTPDMQVVLIATGVGAGIGLLATSLAGIGGFTLVIIAGWLGGYSETHTLIAGLLIALFVGLNVSQLVEFNGR
jgi:hypothetical protein